MDTEENKENAYEQKIKEEDERKRKLLMEQKNKIRNSYIFGILLALPILSFIGFLLLKFNEMSLQLNEKRENEVRRLLLQKKSPHLPLKRLYD